MPTTTHYPRPERNIRDVNEAKAIRRAEIERRCAALDPPLTPNVLSHMESFQAAVQITQPMTDQAWQILKPRLLVQFPYAERKEKERIQQDEILAEEYRQRRQQEAQLKETKDNFDREWETFQNPVRNRLGALADEIIESRWAGGTSVTKDISPKFAADVLLQVRQRFYTEMAQKDEAAAAAGELVNHDSPNGPPTRTLILENMKWLFDTKVKPLTDHFQRELFLCNGCDGNNKFYGFEGVIQHYAAKHTTTLSMGNVVVHWRAEWPEHPPFNPNPSVAKTAYYKVPTPTNTAQTPAGSDMLGPISHENHDPTSEIGLLPSSQSEDNSHYPAHTSAATYTVPRREGYPAAISGQPYPPQSTFRGVSGYSSIPNGYINGTASYNPYPGSQQGQPPQPYSTAYPGQQQFAAFATEQPIRNSLSYFPGSSGNNYGNGPPLAYQSNFQNGVLAAQASTVPGPMPDLYQRQMDEMAKHAKDVFIGIGGVKDLPGSVRIYVVIQLTVSRFKATFANEPSLSMFIDGLDHNATMRPVRSVNGLGCKTCIHSGTGAKLFTLPHLVNHFRTVHVESSQILGYPQAPDLDWKADMIDLPDASIISKLAYAAGMTDSKLGFIASVFQGYFPSPLPTLRAKTNTGPLPIFRRELDMNQEDSSSDQIYGHPYNILQPPSQDTSSGPIEPPGEDEYDPHRPALLGKVVNLESGSKQSHKQTRASTLQDGQRFPNYIRYDSSTQGLQTRTDSERSYDPISHLSQFNEQYISRAYEPIEYSTRRRSPGSDLEQSTQAQSIVQKDEPDMLQQEGKFTDYGIPADYGDGRRQTPGNPSIIAKPRSFNHTKRSTSPVETAHAAEQFLSSLKYNSETGRALGYRLHDNVREHRSEIPRQAGSPSNPHQKRFGGDGSYDQRSMDGASSKQPEDAASVHQARLDPSVSANGLQKGISQNLGSHTQYYEDYRPLSRTQMRLATARRNESPTTHYHTQQSGSFDKAEIDGGVLVRPRSGSYTYRVTRNLQYHHPSRSPHAATADMTLYRPKSPVEEDRGDPTYFARSPPLRRQRDHPKSLSNYDFPDKARYEYLSDGDLRGRQHQPRVEYVRVPIDYTDSVLREPPRYLLSRPLEQIETQYVRYEQPYAGERVEPIYERNGQFFHAPARAFREQSTRATSPLTQGYNY